MRFATLLFLGISVSAGPDGPQPQALATREPEYVQAVEFPYYLYPRAQWERELVWLKNIGVRTVAFSIPWNWHQLRPGEFDFTGRTSPRRDLAGFVHILRKLGLRGWVRPLPPVAGWANGGWPAGADARAQRAWILELERLLRPQTEKHGGPIAFVQGRELAVDAVPPPSPVTAVSAGEPGALARSRVAIAAGRGALLWRDVEDTLYPAGWEPPGVPLLHSGAVDLSGTERPATGALRRDAGLLHYWAPFVPQLRPVALPKTAAGKLPKGVSVTELASPAISAVSVVNQGDSDFHQDLRVRDPVSGHVLVLPGVSVPPGEALWLPVDMSLAPRGLCRECSNFSIAERVVYATAELLTAEFENGILAMEFAAPHPAEVVLQLAREPVGPYLASGKPTDFDWEEKTLRARLAIPASTAPGNRVRVGLAIAAPDASAFFGDARRLVIGQKNVLSTLYSSGELASRSRLRTPEGFTATSSAKSPNEIEYSVTVPPDALHGDFASLVLEADGVSLGRARPQLFRPASIRLSQAIQLHFGPKALAVEPPTVPIEARGGSNVEVVIRNNSPEIRNYRLEPAGEDLEFSPAKVEIAVAAMQERPVSFRIFGKEGVTGLRPWTLGVGGGAELALPFRAVVLPRAGTVAWTADLDGDGSPEWVLESAKIRAVFSSAEGGRWLELTWKDTGTNFLAPDGLLAQAGPVQVRAAEASLEFSGSGWKRTVSLDGAKLTIEQSAPLPPAPLTSQTVANLKLTVERISPSRLTCDISQTSSKP